MKLHVYKNIDLLKERGGEILWTPSAPRRGPHCAHLIPVTQSLEHPTAFIAMGRRRPQSVIFKIHKKNHSATSILSIYL